MSAPLKKQFKENEIELGIDEAGRGCLVGKVFVAGVILPDQFPDDVYLEIGDSKKLTRKKREKLRKYIEQNTIWAVESADQDEIDRINILQATIKCMHGVIDKIRKIKEPTQLLIDGNYFKSYSRTFAEEIPYALIPHGDNLYLAIAAASILAKEHHDEYIYNLLTDHPEFEKYGFRSNMSYGTKIHIDAIKQFGITPYHRKSFKPCMVVTNATKPAQADSDPDFEIEIDS